MAMESLRLKTKRVEVMIDDDPERVITFNPEDVHLRAEDLFTCGKKRTSANKETKHAALAERDI